jgi:manganese/iron transport system ATP-binding protein
VSANDPVPRPAPAGGQAPAESGAHPEPLLVARDVAIAYDRLPVLEGVSGQVLPGESVALIGPNGAGKTTLLKAVLGLVPLVRGSISVLGLPPAAARRWVGYVPQAAALDPEFPVSAGQVVLMGRYPQVGWVRRPSRADRAAAAAALEAVGLADQARARFGVLSGGQRQRVLMARAMAQGARLLLLDEPFTGVDATSEELLIAALAQARAAGAAVLVSTHDLALAHVTSDRVWLLNRRQFGFGPVDDTLTPERLQATYGARAAESRTNR